MNLLILAYQCAIFQNCGEQLIKLWQLDDNNYFVFHRKNINYHSYTNNQLFKIEKFWFEFYGFILFNVSICNPFILNHAFYSSYWWIIFVSYLFADMLYYEQWLKGRPIIICGPTRQLDQIFGFNKNKSENCKL